MLRKEITEHPSTNLVIPGIFLPESCTYSMFNPLAKYARDEDSLKSVQTMGFGLLQVLYYNKLVRSSKDNIKKALQASTAVEDATVCVCVGIVI